MKVVFTQAALKDLDDILNHLRANFPTLIDPFERRVQAIAARLGKWPESAPLTVERPGLRAASLVRYPYRIFYRVTDDAIEIIRIRHTSRRPLEEDS
jgi:plasmid stabilization system protein ParE